MNQVIKKHENFGMKRRLVLYCRCSTAAQSLEIQISDLTRYAQARGFEIIQIFRDFGVSGRKSSRPGLDAMMKLIRQRKADYVLVWSLSRLGRNTSHLLNIIAELESLNVSLISYTEAIDLGTPIGRVMATVLSCLSAFELEVLRERVISGIEAARKKGTKLGRPKLNYRQANEIRRLRGEGLTFQQIRDRLGVGAGTISRYTKIPETTPSGQDSKSSTYGVSLAHE